MSRRLRCSSTIDVSFRLLCGLALAVVTWRLVVLAIAPAATGNHTSALLAAVSSVEAAACRVCSAPSLASERCPRCHAFRDIPGVFFGRLIKPAIEPHQRGFRAPAVLLKATLVDDLLAALQALPILTLGESDLDAGTGGFARSTDNRKNPGHIYYEGYSHALWSRRYTPALSMNPRWGYDFDKTPAPPLLGAFIEATRRANGRLLSSIETRLRSLGSAVGAAMADHVRNGRAFADLALQVWEMNTAFFLTPHP